AIQHLIRETTVWIRLNHENVLEFLGLTQEHGRYDCPALVSPYCDNGTVSTYLKSHSDPEISLLRQLRGVAKGLEYLHQNDVIHGDLKPVDGQLIDSTKSNILVHDDGRPLLCDFGRSRILGTRGFTTRPAGVARYQAPEVHQALPLTKATDVYAFGVTSYEIWTGITPWENKRDDRVILDIVLNNARPVLPENAPPGTGQLWGIFETCWDREPWKRPGMDKVVQDLIHTQVQWVIAEFN
ncbi:Serine/threonine-protein kinase CTR1, partial [Leucoagaricus sp. SymC.cos]